MTDSKPMAWATLRERVAGLPYSDHTKLIIALNHLLDDIDAAAEAMAEQEWKARSFDTICIACELVMEAAHAD